MRVVISEKAQRDLLRIDWYLRERNTGAADALAHRFNSNFQNLERFPFLGRERTSLGPGVRCLVVGIHLVFYVVDDHRLIVLRVIDGRMDVDQEFRR